MPFYDLASPQHERRQNALFYQTQAGHPEQHLRLIAVTGTNGKTTVSSLLAALLRANGENVGLIGTVECFDGKKSIPSEYTTPPPKLLYPLLAEMVQNGVATVIMEASSHALAQERLFGLTFALAIFTNLSRDHLDYHQTKEAYLSAKAKLFENAKISLINADDETAKTLAFHAAGDVYYYAESTKDAEFQIQNVRMTAEGLSCNLQTMAESLAVKAPLIGHFNVYNTAAAISAATLLGIPKHVLETSAPLLTAPAGRMEKLCNTNDLHIFIDYAHTPDALYQALTALSAVSSRLTVLFGAGGKRDAGKRAEMGRIAETLADRVIVTSDNPRDEAPESILADILSGMNNENHIVLTDRKEAIRYAVLTANSGDTLLLAGKGHETYLFDRNGKHDFSEKNIVREALADREKNSKKGT